MNIKCVMICAFLAATVVLTGCGDTTDLPATSKSEIVGTYQGNYSDGTETFKIRADGSFSQTFQRGTNSGYTLNGKWTYETNLVLNGQYHSDLTNGAFLVEKVSDKKRSIAASSITFRPFMIPDGMDGCVTNTKLDVASSIWRLNPVRIELGPWPYFVRKMPDHGSVSN